MPNIFTEDTKIELHGIESKSTMRINEFITKMEKPVVSTEATINGKSQHQILREQRIRSFEQYKNDLKNATHLKIDSQNDDMDLYYGRYSSNKS